MRPQIPVPSKGLQLKATWGAQVANRVNELCAMAPAGVLHREGFGGIGDQALPKNMRDRRAMAGQPMPFDVQAAIEKNQAGTAQRLIIVCRAGSVIWNGFGAIQADATFPNLPQNTFIPGGGSTVYVGEWQNSSTTLYQDVLLAYKITLAPEWTPLTSPVTFGSGTAVLCQVVVNESSQSFTNPYGDQGLYYSAPAQILVGSILLGKVEATLGGTVSRTAVAQKYHGNLILGDILQVNPGGGGGGGGDGTNGTTYPMPFQYTRTDTDDGQGNITSSYLITNCRFYWDGEYHTLADFTPPATGTVWLIATKSGSGAGSWSFQLSTSQGTAANGQQSVKLYDFSGSRITMDYRTTTLMFGPGPRDYLKAGKADGTISATLDATGTSAKATIEGATHDVTIDAAAATQGDVQLRECDYYAPGATTAVKVNVLASMAMRLGIGATITLSEALDNIVQPPSSSS